MKVDIFGPQFETLKLLSPNIGLFQWLCKSSKHGTRLATWNVKGCRLQCFDIHNTGSCFDWIGKHTHRLRPQCLHEEKSSWQSFILKLVQNMPKISWNAGYPTVFLLGRELHRSIIHTRGTQRSHVVQATIYTFQALSCRTSETKTVKWVTFYKCIPTLIIPRPFS